MIICPKKEILVPAGGLTIGMKGFLRLQTVNKFSGKITSDTGFFPNVLLDAGRNYMTTAAFTTSCQVGTDNTAPASSQTALSGHHAGTTDLQSTVNGNQTSSSPYYGWERKVLRFAIGTVAANLTEVGMGWGTSGSTLISRALILDWITKNPTTITPLADEFLDVTYELRYYAPVADITSPQVTLDGITYNTITRAAEVNSEYWYNGIGNPISWNDIWNAYDGNLGTQLQNPSGNASGLIDYSITNGAYENNSYELIITCPVPWNRWNLGAGIRSIRLRTSAGSFQTQFNAVSGGATIPKTTGETMILKWKLAWAAV